VSGRQCPPPSLAIVTQLVTRQAGQSLTWSSEIIDENPHRARCAAADCREGPATSHALPQASTARRSASHLGCAYAGGAMSWDLDG
jgi:hypothetical protein